MLYLSQEAARSQILARHGLAQPYANPLDALQAVFAIQVQYAMSLPVALALRTKGLKPTWHKRDEHKDILKSWTLRSTLHAHTARDHAVALAALRDRLRTRYLEWFKRDLGYDDDAILRQEQQICEALESGPLTRVELHDRVPSLKQIPHAGWGLDLKGLAYTGRLKLIITESGPTRFALHECPCEWHQDEAIGELMRRYFHTYGPATLADFRYWTGLFAVDVKRAFGKVESEFSVVHLEGAKELRYLFGGVAVARIPRVKLLAKFDPLTLGHVDKSLFLSDKDRDRVFRKAGQVEAGVLIDGKYAGTWRLNRKGKGAEVVVEPFRKIANSRLPGIEREAHRAAEALGLKLAGVQVD